MFYVFICMYVHTMYAYIIRHALFQDSASNYLRAALLWFIMHVVAVIYYRRFGQPICLILRVQGFLNPEDEPDSLSRNVCYKLPLFAVQ